MDHRDRLAWARKHLDALDSEIAKFADDDPCRVVRNFNTKTGEHEASVVDVKQTPPHFSLMVGDIVHGMRSALDNLTYALAVKESGSSRADASTNLQFPIADHPLGWFNPTKNKGQRDRIALLSPTVQAEIERLQPCNRIDKRGPNYLSVLRDLSNTDKHRRLVLAITKAMDVELTVTGTGVAGGKRALVSDFYGPLKENTVIAKWSFTPKLTPPDMKVEGKFRIDVMFGDGEARPRHPVRGVLRYIHDHIASDVFSILDPYLA